jgi:glycerol-3-phosphate dehydrogenase
MAELTLDEIVKWLKSMNGSHLEITPCSTAEKPLLSPAEIQGISGILPADFNQRNVEHFCSNEWAVHLDDIMIRRSGWHYYSRNAKQKATEAAQWMAAALDWSQTKLEKELERYQSLADGVADLTLPLENAASR